MTLLPQALPVRQFLLTNLVRSPDMKNLQLRIPIKILASSLDNMGDFPIKGSDECRFDGPALFIRGTQSHYVPDDVLPLIGLYFPRFEVRDVECGHWVISEKPEAFRQGEQKVKALYVTLLIVIAVVEFIEKHQRRG